MFQADLLQGKKVLVTGGGTGLGKSMGRRFLEPGFHLQKSYKVLGVPEEDYEVIAAIAVGRLGDSSLLPDDLRQMELPKDRKPLAEVAFKQFPYEK